MDKERYKILKVNDTILYNENIPLIVEKLYILENNYTGKESIKIHFKNIGNKTISAITFGIEFLNEIGNVKSSKEFNINRLNLTSISYGSYICDLDLVNINLKDEFKIRIKEILFNNKEKIDLNCLLESRINIDELDSLKKLKNQYKRECLHYNIKAKSIYHDYGKYWHCVCGNYYFNDIDFCPDCHVEKEKLSVITDKEYLTKKQNDYEKKQDELYDKSIKTKKKILKICLILVIIIIIVLVIFSVIKNFAVKNKIKNNDIASAISINSDVLNDYESYINKLINEYEENGEIDKAIELLENIEKYDSQRVYSSKFKDIQYLYIIEKYNEKNYEEAYIYLDNILNNWKYKNDTELLSIASVIKYYKAQTYIENEDYEKAKELLEDIEYENSSEQLNMVSYYVGKSYLENEQYEEARNALKDISEQYEDSNELLKEATYNYAIDCYNTYKENENFDLSILETIKSYFEEISDYQDTNNYIAEIAEALKWHGFWHRAGFTSENFNIYFNYFTGIIYSSSGEASDQFEYNGGIFACKSLYYDYEQNNLIYKYNYYYLEDDSLFYYNNLGIIEYVRQ